MAERIGIAILISSRYFEEKFCPCHIARLSSVLIFFNDVINWVPAGVRTAPFPERSKILNPISDSAEFI